MTGMKRAAQGAGTIGLRYTGGKAVYEPPRRIGRWTIEATCPACGGVLEHLADGRPSETESRAIARCSACRRAFKAEVTLQEVTGELGLRPSHPEGCECGSCRRRSAA